MTVKNFTATIYNQSGASVVFEGANPVDFGLTAIEGLSATDYTQNINTNGNFFGGTLSGVKLSPRQIDIDFVIVKNEREQPNRLMLERFFNPLEELDLVVSRLDTTRHIKCRVSKFEITQTHLQAMQFCHLSLIAPNPFMMDMSDYGQDIANVTGMFAPPFLMNATTGQIMGVIKSGDLTTVRNDGDLDVGLTVRFVAKDTVENIKFYNARNPLEYVRVIDTLQNGDTIVITMTDGNKSIRKTTGGVTTNIINKLDRTSNFFKIKQGDNVVGFDADLNKNSLEVWLNYTPLYFGI